MGMGGAVLEIILIIWVDGSTSTIYRELLMAIVYCTYLAVDVDVDGHYKCALEDARCISFFILNILYNKSFITYSIY